MKTTFLSVVFVGLFATVAAAQHGGDIHLDLDSNNTIRTSDQNGPQRVFESEFGESFTDFTDEPGFDSDPGAFPAGTSIGFIIRRALRAWNGADFSVIPAERIEIAFGPLTPVVTPLDDSPVNGFELAVGSNGQWHRHLEFTLAVPAATGIYLLELELYSTSAAVLASKPFWIVFNQDADESEHEAASEWARENLVDPPSCPSDFNGDTIVNSQDFFDFLAAFFASAADFNADGVTNSQDFFDFLTTFFAGC